MAARLGANPRWYSSLCALALALGCNSNRSTLVLDAGGGTRRVDAGKADAGHPPRAGGTGGRAPAVPDQTISGFDAGLLPNLNFCSLHAGAKCDGNADCPKDKLCCAHYDYSILAYSSIDCMDSCSGLDQLVLCHPDDSCGGVLLCRQSFAIPFSFVSLCAPPPQAGQTLTTAPPDVPGRIACGGTSCQVGKEQCCLTAHSDLRFPFPQPEAPYCAPLSEGCACGHVAGAAPSHDEDAGAADIDAGR